MIEIRIVVALREGGLTEKGWRKFWCEGNAVCLDMHSSSLSGTLRVRTFYHSKLYLSETTFESTAGEWGTLVMMGGVLQLKMRRPEKASQKR